MNKIWDPLRRKAVAATPEEQVRQWFIGQLRDSFGVPEHMMMSEAALTFGQKRYRADVLIYDRSAAPLAVVECKRPDVMLDTSVVSQALRYDAVLGVDFIFLTNGVMTLCFERRAEEFLPLSSVPSYEKMLCRR